MRREWWLRDGGDARTPSGEEGERLAEQMPELVPTWRRLTEMVDDEHAGAVLAPTRCGPYTTTAFPWPPSSPDAADVKNVSGNPAQKLPTHQEMSAPVRSGSGGVTRMPPGMHRTTALGLFR